MLVLELVVLVELEQGEQRRKDHKCQKVLEPEPCGSPEK